MNNQDESALRDALFDDVTLLPVIILIVDAWHLVAGLRLVAKHPRLHTPLTRQFERVAMIFQDAIVARHPGAKLAFQPGIGRGSFMKRAAPAMADERDLEIMLTNADGYYIVIACHQATRHSEMGDDLRGRLIQLGRMFQESVIETHPGVAEVLERGWDERFDVIVGEDE